MAFVTAMKYKAPDRILGALDEETPVVIERNGGGSMKVKLLDFLDRNIQSIKNDLKRLEKSSQLSDDELDEMRLLEAELQTLEQVKNWVIENGR